MNINSFNEKVDLGTFSFDSIRFVFDSFNDVIAFRGITTQTRELEKYNLYQNTTEGVIYYEANTDPICIVEYNTEGYNRSYDCVNDPERTRKSTLTIKSNFIDDEQRLWRVLYATNNISIEKRIDAISCVFNDTVVTISGELTCDYLYINDNTDITVTGKLTFGSLYIYNTIIKSLNINGIIKHMSKQKLSI